MTPLILLAAKQYGAHRDRRPLVRPRGGDALSHKLQPRPARPMPTGPVRARYCHSAQARSPAVLVRRQPLAELRLADQRNLVPPRPPARRPSELQRLRLVPLQRDLQSALLSAVQRGPPGPQLRQAQPRSALRARLAPLACCAFRGSRLARGYQLSLRRVREQLPVPDRARRLPVPARGWGQGQGQRQSRSAPGAKRGFGSSCP